MGVSQHVNYDKYPRQGEVGARVRVCFNYDAERTIGGYVLRDDFTEPYRTVIKLDDGRTVFASECQYRFEHWDENSERATRTLPDFWELLDDKIEHWRIEHYRSLARWSAVQRVEIKTRVLHATDAIEDRWYEARARVQLGEELYEWRSPIASSMPLGETFTWLLRSSEKMREAHYSTQDLCARLPRARESIMKYCIDGKHCEEAATLPIPFRVCHKYSGSIVVEDPVVGKRVEGRLAFCAIERDDVKGHCGREARGFEPKPPPRKPGWRRLLESLFGKGERE